MSSTRKPKRVHFYEIETRHPNGVSGSELNGVRAVCELHNGSSSSSLMGKEWKRYHFTQAMPVATRGDIKQSVIEYDYQRLAVDLKINRTNCQKTDFHKCTQILPWFPVVLHRKPLHDRKNGFDGQRSKFTVERLTKQQTMGLEKQKKWNYHVKGGWFRLPEGREMNGVTNESEAMRDGLASFPWTPSSPATTIIIIVIIMVPDISRAHSHLQPSTVSKYTSMWMTYFSLHQSILVAQTQGIKMSKSVFFFCPQQNISR